MSGPWKGLRHFYDVPWNIYSCPGTPPNIQREAVAESIRSTLLTQTIDNNEGSSESHNELSQCIVDPISVKSVNSTFLGTSVRAEFTKGPPFRFIHYHNPAKQVALLLVRGNLGGRSLTSSFFDMIGISGQDMLQLPSTFLSLQLERYLESLRARRSMPTEPDDSFISHVVGKLDITVTARAPVAPNLRSLQISIPATDVWNWLSTRVGHGLFMAQLTDHLESTTGLKLGLAFSLGPDQTVPYAANLERVEAANTRVEGSGKARITRPLPGQLRHTQPKGTDLGEAGQKGKPETVASTEFPMAISEVSCAGFKLNRAGRFMLRKSPVSTTEDVQLRDGIEANNAVLIGAILDAVNEAC